jgi:hypothetical protein
MWSGSSIAAPAFASASLARCGRIAVTLALAAGAFGGMSGAVSAADEPLVIAKQGNFYVGGKYVENKGDRPMVGQIYVQFQIPQQQTHPRPAPQRPA